jgi:hypothetical protein
VHVGRNVRPIFLLRLHRLEQMHGVRSMPGNDAGSCTYFELIDERQPTAERAIERRDVTREQHICEKHRVGRRIRDDILTGGEILVSPDSKTR